MLSHLCLILGCIMVFLVYFKVFLVFIKNKDKKSSVTGFEIAKEITSNYDEINIVDSKEIWMSQYHLKRNVIRLLPKHYEDNHCSSLAISAQLASFSLGNMEQIPYFKILFKFFSSMDWFNKSALFATIVCCCMNTIGDAKIGIVLLGMILIYQYFRFQLNMNCISFVKKKVKISEWNEIKEFLEVFQLLDKSSFIITLLFVLQEFVLILGI